MILIAFSVLAEVLNAKLHPLDISPHQTQAQGVQGPAKVTVMPAQSTGQTPTPPLPPQVVTTQDPGAYELPPPTTIDPLVTKPISADDAVHVGLLRQPSLKTALAAANAARGLVIQARSGLFPTTSLDSSYSYNSRIGSLGSQSSNSNSGGNGGTNGNGATSSSSINGFTNSVQLRQLVFDFGRTLDEVRQAEFNQKSFLQQAYKNENDLIFSIKQQFFITTEAQKQVAFDQVNLTAEQSQLTLATGLFKGGLGAPSDVVTATTNVDNGLQTLVQARNSYLIDRVTLAALIGVDPRTPLTLLDAPNTSQAPPTDIQTYVTDALTNRPDILSAQANLNAAKAGLASAKKELLPSVDLGLSAGTRGSVDPFSSDTTSASLSLTFPFEDGGLTAGRIEQSNAIVSEAETELTSVQLSVVSDVAQSFSNLQSAYRRLDSANASVANAQEGLRLAEGRYRAGVALFVEITQAEASLATAQSNQISAEGSYQIALAQLDHSVGSRIQPLPIANSANIKVSK